MSTPTAPRFLRLHGARTHNLQGVSCAIPHGHVTVVTGPSGAGKSSLVFDTLFAEGQRRFVESMSTYAQQFIQGLERPPLESVEGLLPAVALQAGNPVRNARATVGTLTEAHDLLRLIYTYLGEVACAGGHGPVRAWTPEEAAAALAGGAAGETVTIVAPVARPRQRADDKLGELVRQGYFRLLRDGAVERLEAGASWPPELDPLPLLLGRFRAGEETRSRLAETVEEAFRLARGRVIAHGEDGRVLRLGEDLACAVCGLEARRPVAALFSFNSPLGACPACSGFGRIIGIDRGRVIPDPGKTLRERPFAPWNTPSYEEHYPPLFKACRKRGVPLEVPWRELPEEAREWIWRGGERGWTGLGEFFEWLEGRTYKVHVRVLLARYRGYYPCPACGGARLQPEALRVRLRGRTLPELLGLSVEELRAWLAKQAWSDGERARGEHLLESLAHRLEVLHRVGLDYLTLDRAGRTLSGGEAQRIQLAAALGSGLTGTLYALDEPTVGLHARDSRRLLGLLRDLSARGNTVVVVEHDPTVIRGADHLVELGPGAGEGGGRVVFEGSPHELLSRGETLTARHLRRSGAQLARRHAARRRQERGLISRGAEPGAPAIEILGASAHNLRDVDVRLPLGALTAVTGVSGSGKSTLIEGVLYEGARARRGEADAEPGECREIRGLEMVAETLMVDQRPLGRSSRSNPITAIGAYDELRRLFAGSPQAAALGLTPGHFSFNLDLGRCPDCRGTGTQEVDLQFLGTLEVVCERCQGHRFRPDVLAVTVRGRNLSETLELTVDEALAELADQRALTRKLRLLEQAGLGYLRLGQATSTLSAGEAQRLKLAAYLREGPGARGGGVRGRGAAAGRGGGRKRGGPWRRLLLFDEPTTGLHLSDIALLYRSLRRLVQRGDGVVVVEHQLDLIARADWIVELGPGGGSHGGRVLWCGPLEGFLDEGEGPTAEELRRHLDWQPRRRLGKRVPAA